MSWKCNSLEWEITQEVDCWMAVCESESLTACGDSLTHLKEEIASIVDAVESDKLLMSDDDPR